MNIFYLDKDPKLAARYHVDRHVVKMVLESAQLLCTSVNVFAKDQVTPYRTTHVNHPSALWVRESIRNFNWVYELMLSLNEEFKYRYNHIEDHLSVVKMLDCNLLGLAYKHFPNLELPATMVKVAIPEDCRLGDPVASYRKYYIDYKHSLFSWTKRSIPEWLVKV